MAWRGIGGKARRESAAPLLFAETGNVAARLSRRSRGRRAASSRRNGLRRPLFAGRGAGARAALHIFRKKYRLLLTERAVCVIMKPKIVRSGLFLAKECRQILSARRVLPPSAGSCAYLCASAAAGSAAGKPSRRLQLHHFAWRTYLSLVEYRSASMLIYIGVGGGYYVFY